MAVSCTDGYAKHFKLENGEYTPYKKDNAVLKQAIDAITVFEKEKGNHTITPQQDYFHHPSIINPFYEYLNHETTRDCLIPY